MNLHIGDPNHFFLAFLRLQLQYLPLCLYESVCLYFCINFTKFTDMAVEYLLNKKIIPDFFCKNFLSSGICHFIGNSLAGRFN